MSLSPGARVGSYEVASLLGVGGMGEVYRARDTKLNRDVALKVIADAFALDQERLARFRREAQVLASLNHPHIGAIYGFEDSGDVHALVLELVEGDTLADRIARGPLPFDEALPIARQIAEALEAAHEHGIIHRDLKPANIKVTPDGVVKVLDFGLAKLTGPAESGPHGRPDFSQSPTITSPAMMTGIGTLLGTAAYMSPEQAKGRPADKRSDVWAFGCVLYEMLTARRAFDGEDMTEVLAAVVRAEPDWAALPSDVPVPIQTVLTSCLVKSRGGRVAEMSTVLFVLDKAASLVAPVDPVSGAASLRTSRGRRAITLAGAALGVAATVGTGVWFATRPAEPMPPRVSRLLIAAAGSEALSVTGDELAITPDGAHVVYVGNRGTQLFVRALDALEPVAVFTGAPRAPFISPDGRWIGFRDTGGLMKKVPISGGPAVTITTVDSFVRGALWETDDTIIVATNSAETGLRRITTSTGTATALTRPNRVQGEADHLWPEPLPGGRAVLFTITAVAGGLDAAQVAVLDLQTGKHTVLFRGGSHARFVPSGMKSATRGPGREDGHLVYAAGGALWAVPFDPVQLETHGTPVPVVPQVVTTPLGGADAVIAGNGTLAYVSGGVTASTAPRAGVGGPSGTRDADPRPAARVCVSAAVAGWYPGGGVHSRSAVRRLDVGSAPRDSQTCHVRPRRGLHAGVDARWAPIFQFRKQRRPKSLLASGRWYGRRVALVRECQPAGCDGCIARWPCRDLHRDSTDHG